ncbi:CBS domain-containing protein [Amycolatopsis anabasis]|uniref:CBS domain-containing protein n=1 Tax=Amycolatopsis anabasis TaxID=1840409 RepID=UPI00131B1653|nr:CBS domain-containing protein [Amycolatopsis anabasis]
MHTIVVDDVMTQPVVSVIPSVPFKEIVSLLADNRLGAVPVVDGAYRPIGMVSEANLLINGRAQRNSVRLSSFRWRVDLPTAGTLMSKVIYTIARGETAAAAGRRLVEGGYRRLFVVDGSGRLVGVLARRDLLRLYLRRDGEISRDIREHVLRDALPLKPDAVTVRVQQGVVKLSGTVDRRSDADRVTRLTEAVPGVVAVRNQLRCVFEDVLAQWT